MYCRCFPRVLWNTPGPQFLLWLPYCCVEKHVEDGIINHNWSLPLPSTTIGRYLCHQPQLVVTFAINQNWSLPLPSKYSKQAFTFDSTLYFIVSFLVCFLGIVFEIDAFSLAALTVLTFLDKFKINMGTEVKVN